jgi:cytochrome P450
MVAMLFLLLFAGHATTTHFISGSVRELLRNPGLRDWLEEDWSRADPGVKEFLRFLSSVQFTKPRFVRKDVELGGVPLKRGEKSCPCWSPGISIRKRTNIRKSSSSSEDRTGTSPSGAGIHFCLGHQLARIEGKCALQPCSSVGRSSSWP